MKIRTKLIAAFLVLGIAPMAVLGVFAWRASQKAAQSNADTLTEVAKNIADKVDRNLFERYGDVQAFGLNRIVLDREQWYKPGEENAIVRAMNGYIDTYDLYYFTYMVDLEGKLIAVNTKDKDGKPIETTKLYETNYADTTWFKDAMAGRFLTSKDGSFTGTAVGDFYVDDVAKEIFHDDGLALTYTAPVKDEEGKIIAVWHNVAKWSLVEEIYQTAYGELKNRDLGSAELSMVDKNGVLIVDYDPKARGNESFVHDMAVLGQFNLVEKNVEAAQRVVKGERGAIVSTPHARKGINQTAGFAPCVGALGYPGLGWGVMVRVPTSEALAQSNAMRMTIMTTFFGALAVILVGSFLITGALIKPIRTIVTQLRDIAEGEGDLTKRADDKRPDEMGELGKWFNAFITKVQGTVGEVASAAREVASAATQIAASSEQMAAGLTRQQEQTTQVSASVSEMTTSITEVARKTSEAAAAAEQAGNDSKTGGEVVAGTIREIKGVAEQVAASANVVGELGKKGEKIGVIIGVINDIADQTNLLALNAAIEAARAGEHGRGFAVVADEVRKLAERTTQATEEVGKSIREIQADTGNAVKQIETGSAKVSGGVEMANSAGEALERISAGSHSLQAMVRSIASAAEEQSSASEQIAKSIEQINSVTRESSQGAGQAAQAAAQLSQQAEKMLSLVGRFKV